MSNITSAALVRIFAIAAWTSVCSKPPGWRAPLWFLALSLVLFTRPVVGGELLDADAIAGRVHLAGKIDYYESKIPLTIAQIKELDAKGLFKPLKSTLVTSNGRLVDHWLKVEIKKSTAHPQELVLDAGTTVLTRFSIFFDSGSINGMGEGASTPEIGVFHRNDGFPHGCDRICGIFKIDTPGLYVAYIKAQSIYGARLDAALWRQDDFERHERRKNLIFGIGYGLLGVAVFVSMALLLIFRDAIYVWSSLNALMALSTMLSWNGHIYKYLPSDLSVLAWPLIAVLPIFGIYCYARFSAEFLSIERYSALSTHALLWIGRACLLTLALFAAGQLAPALLISNGIGLLAPAVVLFAGYQALRSGYLPARYFIAGFSALTVISIAVAATNLNIWPIAYRNEMLLAGCVVESMFFCWAQVARIMRLHQLSGISKRAANTEDGFAPVDIQSSHGAKEEAWEGMAKSAIMSGVRTAILALKLQIEEKSQTVGVEKTNLNSQLEMLVASELNQGESSYHARGNCTYILFTGVASREVLAARVEYFMEVVRVGLQSLPIECRLSIGVSICPNDGGNLILLRNKAVQALLLVMGRGGNGYAFHDEIVSRSASRA